MGYSVALFTGHIDENLLCSICSNVLENAVLTNCGHSFCRVCLETWLARPDPPSSCPECRHMLLPGQFSPILAVRNLVMSLEVHCEYREHGCAVTIRLESLKRHAVECNFSPVECVGCGVTVPGHNLAQHHSQCQVIVSVLKDNNVALPTTFKRHAMTSHDSNISVTETSTFNTSQHNKTKKENKGCFDEHGSTGGSSLPVTKEYLPDWQDSVSHVTQLASRVAGLELQLCRMKKDLDVADAKNRKMERDLDKAKQDVHSRRHMLLTHDQYLFDPEMEFARTASSVKKLANYISHNFTSKPPFVDISRIFHAIRRCYQTYGCFETGYEHDVHMLLATAYTCDWFSDTQKMSIGTWLHSSDATSVSRF